MLDKIYIRNFKSLQNVSLELKDVNLLIGANNSGKSNLLKALEFFYKWVHNEFKIKQEDFDKLVFRDKNQSAAADKKNALSFSFIKKEENSNLVYHLSIFSAHHDNIEHIQLLGNTTTSIDEDF